MSMRMVISAGTFVTLAHCIKESNLMIFDDPLVRVPEESVSFAVVKTRILLWG